MVTGRRAVQRLATAAEIKRVAREQMAAAGAAGLSLRAVAAAMGITAPAIYRYFANRDALVTALIVDAFDALGAAIRTAIESQAAAGSAARLLAALRAYRAWSLTHPSEFALLFGTPIPGYVAPREVTVPAARRAFAALLAVPTAAWERGEITIAAPSPSDDVPGAPLPPAVYAQVIEDWATCHGLISLELTGHLAPAIGDPAAAYERAIRHIAQRLGLVREPHPPP
jgi:AcrR family transcriptional regulator